MRRETRVQASIWQLAVLLFLVAGAGCSGLNVNRDVSSLVICTTPLCANSTKTLALVQGQPRQVFATASYVNGTTKDVTNSTTWLSSNQTCASIGASNGLIMAAPSVANACTSGITAGFGPVTSSATILIVTPGTLLSIDLIPSTTEPAGGSTMTFTALGSYTGTSQPQDITALVTWRSDSSVMTLTQGSGSAAVASAPGQVIHVSASFLGISSRILTITVH
jgi:hypothetical protein